MGYREMPIQIRAVDVMAGGGGGARPAPSIRHQKPRAQTGTEHIGYVHKQFTGYIPGNWCLALAVQWDGMRKVC